MFLLTQKVVRGSILALMFFLAGTAYCSCDSYDPDPYDDTPPVVTVEFNYVVPSGINIRPQHQSKNKLSLYRANTVQQMPSATVRELRDTQVNFAFRQGPPQWAVPLRR